MYNLKLVFIFASESGNSMTINPMFSLTYNSDYTYRTKWKIDAELETDTYFAKWL